MGHQLAAFEMFTIVAVGIDYLAIVGFLSQSGITAVPVADEWNTLPIRMGNGRLPEFNRLVTVTAQIALGGDDISHGNLFTRLLRRTLGQYRWSDWIARTQIGRCITHDRLIAFQLTCAAKSFLLTQIELFRARLSCQPT
jgi:hypothetical protein